MDADRWMSSSLSRCRSRMLTSIQYVRLPFDRTYSTYHKPMWSSSSSELLKHPNKRIRNGFIGASSVLHRCLRNHRSSDGSIDGSIELYFPTLSTV